MKRVIGIFFLLCCCPGGVGAVAVAGLYEAEVAVADRSAVSREAAVRDSLSMALVKLTGRRSVSGDPRFAPVLEQAGRFVRQYRYRQTQAGASSPGAVSWSLAVRFDEGALNQALRDLGIPVWGRERPSLLVWLVVERDGRRFFADAEEPPGLLSALQQQAARRGVSALFPLLDIEDAARLRPTDVWGGFKDAILAASARYRADIALTASLTSSASGVWEGDWRSYRQGKPERRWRTETDLPALALEEGVDRVIDELATEFVTIDLAGGLQDVEITLGGVDTVTQYTRVLRYLESLSPVSGVQVREVRAGQLRLTLSAHGGAPAIMRVIDLGGVLEPVEDAGDAYYRLLP